MIRCLMCGAPVENEERNWFDPGETNRRVWLCNFHHEPFRTGEAWIEKKLRCVPVGESPGKSSPDWGTYENG